MNTRETLERRLAEALDATSSATAELKDERRRANSREGSAVDKLEQTIASHRAENRELREVIDAEARATGATVLEATQAAEARVAAAVSAMEAAQREVAEALETKTSREGEVSVTVCRWYIVMPVDEWPCFDKTSCDTCTFSSNKT